MLVRPPEGNIGIFSSPAILTVVRSRVVGVAGPDRISIRPRTHLAYEMMTTYPDMDQPQLVNKAAADERGAWHRK